MKTHPYRLLIITGLAIMLLHQNVLGSDYKTLLNLSGYWKFSLGDDMKWSEPAFNDKDWDKIYAPSAWENQGYVGYDGFAWYRKDFYVPETNTGQTITLHISNIDDADEIYFNGHLIGKSGIFPPNYITAYNWDRKYIVPSTIIKKDAENEISIRIYDDRMEGGIVGNIINLCVDADEELLDVNFAGLWKFRLYDNKSWKEPDYNDKDWAQIQVPMTWESQGYFNHDGYAWYRKEFSLPKSLESEKLYMVLGKIDDYDEVFLNGKKIGETSNLEHDRFFRSNFNWGFGIFDNNSGDWTLRRIYEIPKDLIKSGKNIIAVRVNDYEGAGGIYEGPVGIMNEENMKHYKSKYHVGESLLKALYDFFTE
jgi:hypothetical protein